MSILRTLRFVPSSCLRALARMGASTARITNASIYRSIRKNFVLVRPYLSDSKRDELAITTLTNQLLSSADSLKSWSMSPSWSIKQIKAVHNFDILQQGLSDPNGMLAIVPHIGTWEMMNAWLNQFGKPVIMYKPAKSQLIDEFILQGRQRLNATLVPTDSTGVKAIYKTLKQGGFSIILPDHVPDVSGGVIAPFFGIPTLTSTLAIKLAQKTRCSLVGLSCIRREDGDGFDVFCYQLDNPILYDKDTSRAVTALNDAMQSMIENHFEHYMWGYRRFKFTPFGDNPYLLTESQLLQKIHAHLNNQSKESS